MLNYACHTGNRPGGEDREALTMNALQQMAVEELADMNRHPGPSAMGRLTSLAVDVTSNLHAAEDQDDDGNPCAGCIERVTVAVRMTARYEGCTGGETLLMGTYDKAPDDYPPDWRTGVDFTAGDPSLWVHSLVQWLDEARIERRDIYAAVLTIVDQDGWAADPLRDLLEDGHQTCPIWVGPHTPPPTRVGGPLCGVAIIEGVTFTPSQLATILVACDPSAAVELVADELASWPAPADGGF